MRLMSFVRPSFSHIFLNRRSICSAVSLPRLLTLIIAGTSFRGDRCMRLPASSRRQKQPPAFLPPRLRRISVLTVRNRSRMHDLRGTAGSHTSQMRHPVGKLQPMSIGNTIHIRVRYPEVDAMGYLHHSRYLQYFEIGRVELLRQLGFSYADLERDRKSVV